MDLINEFIATLEKRKYHKDEFYDLFLDYVDDKGISLTSEEETEMESKAYQIAREKGYAGYDIILSLTEIDDFRNKLDSYIKQTGFYLFHFINERDDEKILSLSEIWDKWNNHPPLGWVGSWCSCGEFFPYTLDMGSMDLENNLLHPDTEFKPITFSTNEIERVDFCSDNFIRFILKDGRLIAAKPYKVDKSLIYNFVSNPLDLL
jgi:hypothetical protein